MSFGLQTCVCTEETWRRAQVGTVCLMVCLPSQLDSADEQAAQIRRELDGRLQQAEKVSRVRSWAGAAAPAGGRSC